MSRDNLNRFKKGESGNPSGRPKGSKNRKTIAREWLAFLQEETNPISGQIETLSMEDIITLSTIFKAKQGDVSAYKALMDSAYGSVKQNVEITEGETPIFKQLDIDVIE